MTLYKMSIVKDIPMEACHNMGTKHNQQYINKLSYKTPIGGTMKRLYSSGY